MIGKDRRSPFWKVALYYGVLIVLLLVLVGIVQPEWLKYLPVGGLEGLPDGTALTGGEFALGQVMTSTQPRGFFENALNLFSAMIGSLVVAIPLRWVYLAKGLGVKTELNSKSDSYFTFASIGVGLAIGAGYLAIALALAAFFSLTMLIATPVSTSYRTEI